MEEKKDHVWFSETSADVETFEFAFGVRKNCTALCYRVLAEALK